MRSPLIQGRLRLLLVMSVVCGLTAAASAEELKFATVTEGSNSGITTAGMSLITNADDWANYWSKHTANVEPKLALPNVDFSKETVAVLTLGQKPTGGFAITVRKVVATKASLEIHFSETAPGPCDLTTDALTSPFHFVRIPQTVAAPAFKVRFVKLPAK